jgi:hypothetical protein
MPRPDCEDCQSLWREYYTCTNHHIALDGKLKLAFLDHDRERVELLAPEVKLAEEARLASRDAFKRHKTEVHPSEKHPADPLNASAS